MGVGGVSSMCVLPQGVVGWHPPYISLASRFGRELARSVQAEVGHPFLDEPEFVLAECDRMLNPKAVWPFQTPNHMISPVQLVPR